MGSKSELSESVDSTGKAKIVSSFGSSCSGFRVLNKFYCLVRFDKTILGKMTFLLANETPAFLSIRKPFGMGLPFSEKEKLFGTSFPRWKWESGFPEVRLFLG